MKIDKAYCSRMGCTQYYSKMDGTIGCDVACDTCAAMHIRECEVCTKRWEVPKDCPWYLEIVMERNAR